MSAEMTLREVCDLFRISADTVRRWEKQGRLPASKRTSGNQRRWDALELARMAPGQCRPARWPSYDFVSLRTVQRWEAASWESKCQAPGCVSCASNATLYVAAGGMGHEVMFWCHEHRGGLGEKGIISGADDGKVVPVFTLRGAVRACIGFTSNKAMIKHLVGQLLAAKGVQNG